MTPTEALRAAIRVLGSQTALAAAAGEKIKTGHVFHWLSGNGVPAAYCPAIERATRDKGEVVPCELMRPDVDWAAVRCAAEPSKVAA